MSERIDLLNEIANLSAARRELQRGISDRMLHLERIERDWDHQVGLLIEFDLRASQLVDEAPAVVPEKKPDALPESVAPKLPSEAPRRNAIGHASGEQLEHLKLSQPIAVLRLSRGWEDKLNAAGVNSVGDLNSLDAHGGLKPGFAPRIGPEACTKIRNVMLEFLGEKPGQVTGQPAASSGKPTAATAAAKATAKPGKPVDPPKPGNAIPDAKEGIPGAVELTDERMEFWLNDGYEAAKSGKKKSDCPFDQPGSALRHQWMRGWDQGRLSVDGGPADGDTLALHGDGVDLEVTCEERTSQPDLSDDPQVQQAIAEQQQLDQLAERFNDSSGELVTAGAGSGFTDEDLDLL